MQELYWLEGAVSSTKPVARQEVPIAARWFSAGSCGVAAVLLLVVLFISWGDGASRVQSAVLILLVFAGLVAARLFYRSGAELHLCEDGVVLKLYPLWSATIPSVQIEDAGVVQVEPLPREWGWIGSPDSPKGRVIGVGNIRAAVQFRLVDGRRYSLTLNPGDHDLPALVEQINVHIAATRSRPSSNL